MAFNLGDIFVTFKARTEDLQSGVAKVKTMTAGVQQSVNRTSFKEFATNAGNAFSNVASKIQSVVTKLALVATGSSLGVIKFFSLASSLETTQARMAALAGGTEKARKILGELYTYTLGKPIAFPDAAKAAQTLMGYGVAATDVVDRMKTLSAFSIVTGSDMGQLALAMGQVNAKGHLMGQEIIQLTNNFVPVSQVIAKYFNVSVQEAMELMDDGKISAEDFNKAMASFIPQDEIAKQSNTFKNRLISLQGQVRAFGLALIGVKVDPALGLVVEPGGLFDKMSRALPIITAKMKEIKPVVVGAFQWLVDNSELIKNIIFGIAAAWAAAKLAAAGMAIATAIATGGMSLIIPAVIALIGFLVALQSRFNWIGQVVQFLTPIWNGLVAIFNQYLMPSLRALWNTIVTQLAPALMNLWSQLMRIWNIVAPVLLPILKALGAFIGGQLVAHIWLFINGINFAIKIISAIIGVIAGAIRISTSLSSWFIRLGSSAANGVRSALGWFGRLPGTVAGIVSRIASFFSSLPGRIGRGVAGVVGALTSPFRTAFNSIISLWNNTVGRISFRVPDWVPGIGGKGWSVPQFASGVENFAGGWAIVGERGPELTYLPKGSDVYSNNKSRQMLQGGGISVYGDIKIDNQNDADYFFRRFDRDVQLEGMGVSPATGAA